MCAGIVARASQAFLLSPHINSLHLLLFYRGEDRGAERLSSLPKLPDR